MIAEIERVASHIDGHFGIPCDLDLAEAVLYDPYLEPLRDIVQESLRNT
jgi:hypothetical protein